MVSLKSCYSLYQSYRDSEDQILPAARGNLVEKIVKGTTCVFAIRLLVKGDSLSLSSQWSLLAAIILTVQHFIEPILYKPTLWDPSDPYNLAQYQNASFYIPMAKRAISILVGCSITTRILANPIFMEVIPRGIAVQTLCSLTQFWPLSIFT